jgi:hypothetical protein
VWLTARAPVAYTCYVCGRGFGSESLMIHVPRCEKLFAAREAGDGGGGACPAGAGGGGGGGGPSARPARRRLPPRPAALAAPLPRGVAAVEAFNAEMQGVFESRVLAACQHCGRTFM